VTIYMYVHPAYADCIFYSQTTALFTSLKQAGVVIATGDDEFSKCLPLPSDKLITYGVFDNVSALVERWFLPENRWMFVVDEQGGGDNGPYSRALSYMQKRDAKNILVTYQNAKDLMFLTNSGVRFSIMPHCVLNVRQLTNKTRDVIVSGQFDQNYYPVRTRVAGLIQGYLKNNVEVLPHPGFEISTAHHNLYGERYFEHVETFRMGVVCKAGWHDRMVGKYIEFGACHVLPIGDCPSYMPKAMKESMLDVSEMKDADLISEVARLLATPDELNQRIETYSECVAAYYTALPNARRVVEEISS